MVPWMAAALLVIAGAAKLRDPAPGRAALRLAGLPSAAAVVRAVGIAELAVAAAVLGVGGRLPAVALVAAYAAFTAFTWTQHRDPAASCGCFGAASVPLSRLHVAVDALLAAASLPAAVAGAPSLATAALRLGMPTGGVLVVLVLTGAALLQLLLTGLPELADHLEAS